MNRKKKYIQPEAEMMIALPCRLMAASGVSNNKDDDDQGGGALAKPGGDWGDDWGDDVTPVAEENQITEWE